MPLLVLWPVCAFVAGVALGIVQPWPDAIAGGLLVIAAAISVAAFRWRHDAGLRLALTGGYLMAGVALSSHAERAARAPPLATLLDVVAPRDEAVAVVGRLEEDASPDASGTALVVLTESICHVGRCVHAAGGLHLTVTGIVRPADIDGWRAGRRVRAAAWLRTPTRYRDPGVPDHRLQLARRGIVLVGTIKSAALVAVVDRGPFLAEAAAAIRAYVRAAVGDTVAPRDPAAAAVLLAVLIGDRSTLDAGLIKTMQEAGTYHVIAISGGNIAIMAALLLAAARLARVPWRMNLAGTAIALALYAELAGGGSSVMRATVMAIVYLAARALDHGSAARNSLAIAAGAVLAWTPLALVEPGFVLTFGATVALVVFSERFERGISPGWLRPVAALGAASLAVEIVLLPFGAAFFSRVTLAGLALNFAAVPLMAVLQVSGLALVAVHAASLSAAHLLAIVCIWAADGILDSARLVHLAPWSTWRVPAPPAIVLCAYCGAVAALVAEQRWVRWIVPWHRWARPLLLGTAAAMAVWIATEPALGTGPARGHVRVTWLDVGQGDAAIVQVAGGPAVVVDAGGLGGASEFDIGERVVSPSAWALGVRRPAALVVTHGDADHLGGAPAVLEMLGAREIWEGVPVNRHAGLAALRAAADAAHVPWRTVQAGDALRLGEVRLAVLHPPPPDWERQRVRNDDSVVIDVRVGEVSILLTGDAGAPVEPAIAARLEPALLRVVKLGHHGSASATTADWLAAARPRAAIVSCGRHNRFGHPSPAVLRRLMAADVRVFRTDEQGAITLDTDGRAIEIRTWTGETARYSVARTPAGARPASAAAAPRASRGLATVVRTWLERTIK